MTAALRYEWARITSLRSTWWLSAFSIVVGSGFTFVIWMIMRLNAGDEIEGELTGDGARFYLNAAMTQFSNIDPMFYLLTYAVAIIGILAWGHEYRHGMIRATLTAVPNRYAVFAAKFLLVAAWVSVVVVISCVLSLLFALLWFTGLDTEIDWLYLFGAMGKRIVYTVMITWFVMGATVLIRHQTFSLVLLYLWPLGLEMLIRIIAGVFVPLFGTGVFDALRFMPFNAAGRIMQDVSITDPLAGLQDNLDLFGNPLSALGAFLVFGAYTFGIMGLALFSFVKRDA